MSHEDNNTLDNHIGVRMSDRSCGADKKMIHKHPDQNTELIVLPLPRHHDPNTGRFLKMFPAALMAFHGYFPMLSMSPYASDKKDY